MIRSVTTLVVSALCAAGAAQAQEELDLRTAIDIAINSNPEIGQAVQNREAIDFERRQARGLYHPRVNLEASAGFRELDNPSRDAAGLGDQTLEPLEIGIFAEQVLFDGFGRRGEMLRQAARLDGASYRVLERSEYIALEVAREYINYGLQDRLTELAENSVAFHEDISDMLAAGVSGQTTSATDLDQARERLNAARRQLREAEYDRSLADIGFRRLVGIPMLGYVPPSDLDRVVPASLDMAIGSGRSDNPEIQMAQAGISAAEGELLAAKSEYLPTLSLEGRARAGEDIDAFEGETTDVQVRAVVRWTLYDGGIALAGAQEQLRRVSEERFRLHQVDREVEQEVRQSWERLQREEELLNLLEEQLAFADQVVAGYTDQFEAGQRSLLDLLDAQNTRINVAQAYATSEHAHLFAQYRLMAAMGGLLDALGLEPVFAAEGGARERADAPPVDAGEDDVRRYP